MARGRGDWSDALYCGSMQAASVGLTYLLIFVLVLLNQLCRFVSACLASRCTEPSAFISGAEPHVHRSIKGGVPLFQKGGLMLVIFFSQLYCPIGKFGLFPPGKASSDRVALPNLPHKRGTLVTSNSDMHYMIFSGAHRC